MDLERLKLDMETGLSEKRKRHVYRVVEEVDRLCQAHGFPENVREKARIAALCHDRYRGLSQEDSDAAVRRLGLDDHYIGSRNLAHGKIAEKLLPESYGIEDPEILSAVSYHTTGRPCMSIVEQLVYLADGMEPGRKYPGVERIRKAAYKNLDKGCYLSMRSTMQFVEEKGVELDQETRRAFEYYQELRQEQKRQAVKRACRKRKETTNG